MSDWLDIGGFKMKPKTINIEERGPLPEGRVELETVRVLREKFGGVQWRRVCNSRAQIGFGYETSTSWKNEYGVEVEVMT